MRSTEASTGIIILSLDYFYHIGIQLNTALGMPNNEALRQEIVRIVEALAKCPMLVQTGPLVKKVQTTIQRVFKSFSSTQASSTENHVGKRFAFLLTPKCHVQEFLRKGDVCVFLQESPLFSCLSSNRGL